MSNADTLRKIALALPEVTEKETWDTATFRVNDKVLAILSGDGASVSIKATHEDQDALVTLQPDVFSVARYTGRFGWVSAKLSLVDPDHLADLLKSAWLRTAPKRLVKQFKE